MAWSIWAQNGKLSKVTKKKKETGLDDWLNMRDGKMGVFQCECLKEQRDAIYSNADHKLREVTDSALDELKACVKLKSWKVAQTKQ